MGKQKWEDSRQKEGEGRNGGAGALRRRRKLSGLERQPCATWGADPPALLRLVTTFQDMVQEVGGGVCDAQGTLLLVGERESSAK